MAELSNLAHQAETREMFVAYRLAAYQQARGLDDLALTAELGCEVADLPHLRLCTVPHPDRFQEEVALIATHTHVTNIASLSQILSVA
jgi:hypothetical protein